MTLTTRSLLGWLAAFAAGAVVGVAGHHWLQRPGTDEHPEPAGEHAADTTVLTLADAAVAQAGITTGAPAPVAAGTEQRLEGRLELDPSASSTVRAPVAGTLHLRAEPLHLGDLLEADTTIAQIVPRLSAIEQLDLQQRRQQAAIEVEAATSAAELAAKNLARIEAVNRGEPNLAEAVVEEATERVRQAELRRTAARQMVATLNGDTTVLAMQTPAAGTIVEIAAHDGESVEAGQPVLHLARFEALLARLPLQPGLDLRAPPGQIRLRLVRTPARDLAATFVMLASASAGTSELPALVYRLSGPATDLRPGDAVSAFLPAPGPGAPAFLLPPTAVFRHLGQAFVFVRTGGSGGNQLFRRVRVEVVDWTTGELRVMFPGLGADEPAHLDVVTTGAVDLLAHELRGQTAEGG
ncbi:MAG TPA: biotin/lipoyl-containing protein [Planctomycetota bacterium]|nr:biotin/lipoyl-containing protein [Planctomycetota bacterium]